MRHTALLGTVTIIIFMMLATTPKSAHALQLLEEGQTVSMQTSVYGKGDGFHGKVTSSCTLFHKDGLTVAHKRLPFGTVLALTNPDTGLTVTARVTDRGPFVKGRHLDISSGVARRRAMKEGVKQLSVTVVSIPDEPEYGTKCAVASVQRGKPGGV